MAASSVSRWLSWRPGRGDSSDAPLDTKPTEPTKPASERSFVGSVGFGRTGHAPDEDSRETEDEPRISWYEWKARMLNEIFETQGVTGKPSNITADNVRRWEEARRGGDLPAKCRPKTTR